VSETASPATPALPTQSVSAESLLSAPGTGIVVSRPVGGPPHSTKPIVPNGRKRKPKAPKESKVYKAVLAYVALKAQGLKGPEIAEYLGLTPQTLRTYVCQANKRGLLGEQDLTLPEDRLDVILSSKAVRNIEEVLDERVEDGDGIRRLTMRASDISLEVMRGTGLLKQHQISKSEGGTNNVFALKVEVVNAGGQSPISLRAGTFGGSPAFDAEIIESE